MTGTDTSGAISTLQQARAEATRPGQWERLVREAMVGTKAGSGDSALALLDRAALVNAAHAVGAPPAGNQRPMPPPVPPDGRPQLSDAACDRLRSILSGFPKHLPEWLHAVRVAGFRLPAPFFPPLLEQGRTNTKIRVDLALVLGEPGHWLAALHAPWRYLLREAASTALPDTWDEIRTGGADARLAYIAGCFLTDPAAARRLVREDWGQQPTPVKVGRLRLLARYPDPADLPFLEGLRGERTGAVREEAKEAELAAGRVAARTGGEDLTAAVVSKLSQHGFGRELYSVVAKAGPEIWPDEAARLMLDAAAARAALPGLLERADAWVMESLLTAMADHTPVALRGHLARLVAQQSLPADPTRPDQPSIDLAALLAQFDFRCAMHAELTITDD
ncbi:MAG TPA: DUF5691 domain-containing protein [Actinocrinis sp.]|jgi:hypothetical protein